MHPADVPPEPGPPRWLADAMLGKLARYLRFLGHDTEYATGRTDADLRTLARAERRTLLTRDHRLAATTEPSLLIRSSELSQQLREVHVRYPDLSFAVTFDRCPECNLPLERWAPPADPSRWPAEIPVALVTGGLPVAECAKCQRHYWEGSHARRIRRVVSDALGGLGDA